jgi:hypothetical protein
VWSGGSTAEARRGRRDLGDLSRRLGVHSGQGVRVLLERKRWRLVPEAFRDDLDGNARLEREARLRMATIMQPNRAQAGVADDPLEGLTELGG